MGDVDHHDICWCNNVLIEMWGHLLACCGYFSLEDVLGDARVSLDMMKYFSLFPQESQITELLKIKEILKRTKLLMSRNNYARKKLIFAQ